MKKSIIWLLAIYQRLFSPALVVLFGHACRFSPTCSRYSQRAIDKYGLRKGLRLGLVRLAHCQTWF